jgi:hypothetical protein
VKTLLLSPINPNIVPISLDLSEGRFCRNFGRQFLHDLERPQVRISGQNLADGWLDPAAIVSGPYTATLCLHPGLPNYT